MINCLRNIKVGDTLSYDYISITGQVVKINNRIYKINWDGVNDDYHSFLVSKSLIPVTIRYLMQGVKNEYIKNIKIYKN